MRKITAISFFVFVLLLSFQSKAFAQTASPSPRLGQQLHQQVKDLRQTVKNDIKDSSPSGKACQAHIGVVKTRTLVLGNRGEVLTTRLSNIVEMVDKYYTTKMVPAGQTVTNYETLVSDVNSKKAALTPLVDKVKTDSTGLTCDNGRATGQFLTFRSDAKNLITAFHAYRLSVVNLVKAVVTASGASNSATVTPTGEANL